MTRILITGDTVVTKPCVVSPMMKAYFMEADHRIFNLEAPVTNEITELHKTGPSIKQDCSSLKSFLEQFNPTLFCLANNHISDFGQSGLGDTIDFCNQHHLGYTGITDRNRNYNYTEITQDVAVLNICENEWSTLPGQYTAQGYHANQVVKSIQSLARKYRLVIVIYHGGNEHYALPSPRLQERFRNFIDAGADLVVGHHTHVISGREVYRNKNIYYSLGNFLFPKEGSSNSWNIGLTVEVNVNYDFSMCLNEVFTIYNPQTSDLDLVSQQCLKTITSEFDQRSQIVSDPALVKDNWDNYVREQREEVLWHLSPVHAIRNPVIRKLGYWLGIRGLSLHYISMLLNYSRCEALSEISEDVLITEIKRRTVKSNNNGFRNSVSR